jgi:acetyltransferase
MDLVGYTDLRPGNLGLITQSGNMALSMVTEATINGHLGFSTYVGVGNQVDIQFDEYLDYFAADDNTKVVIFYIEGFKNGLRFLQHAKKLTQKKPVIVYKSGRTAAGRKSASSHTGAMAGSFNLTIDVLRQAGVTVVRDADKLLPVAEALSLLPPPGGDQVAILADGGGHATIATDTLIESGLKLAKLSSNTLAKLTRLLPPAASLANPIDVAGGTDKDPGVFADCAKILMEDAQVDAVLIVGLFGGYGIRFSDSLKQIEVETADRLGRLMNKTAKPLILQSLYTPIKPEPLEILRNAAVPVYCSIETAVFCLAALIEYTRSKDRNFRFAAAEQAVPRAQAKQIVTNAIKADRNALFEYEAKDLLQAYGITVPAHAVIRSEKDLQAIGLTFRNQPVAMKVISQDILHKSDAGGVKLNIQGDQALQASYVAILKNASHYLPTAHIEGVLVSPMARSGVEVIIGVVQDPIFGSVLMFGLGGIFVEVLKDVVFRAIPLSAADAHEMLEEIASSKILDGVRGKSAVDRAALVDLILKVSACALAHPEITEIDLNPVIVHKNGYDVVDARIILSPLKQKSESA